MRVGSQARPESLHSGHGEFGREPGHDNQFKSFGRQPTNSRIGVFDPRQESARAAALQGVQDRVGDIGFRRNHQDRAQ